MAGDFVLVIGIIVLCFQYELQLHKVYKEIDDLKELIKEHGDQCSWTSCR